MNFRDAVGCYMDDMERRNFSERTLSNVEIQLRNLERFLVGKEMTDLKLVTPLLLTQWQLRLMDEPTRQGIVRQASSRNKLLSAAKGFFRFLKNEGHLESDPAHDIEYAKEPRRLPRNILTASEAVKIIESVDTTTTLGFRDRTILEVMYASGIRRNELLSLKPEDVNLEEGLLRINEGKGGHDRVVPLSRVAVRFLESYMKAVRSDLLKGRHSDRLFVSLRGKGLVGETLRHMIRKAAKTAGVDKRVTPHTWRHSVATHLVKNEAHLRCVQALLGHRSLSTTEKYLHLTINDLKAAHRKFHPREKGNERG